MHVGSGVRFSVFKKLKYTCYKPIRDLDPIQNGSVAGPAGFETSRVKSGSVHARVNDR